MKTNSCVRDRAEICQNHARVAEVGLGGRRRFLGEPVLASVDDRAKRGRLIGYGTGLEEDCHRLGKCADARFHCWAQVARLVEPGLRIILNRLHTPND